jgi:DNA-directed RNA polymerase subunit RPC12/RpoP
MGGLRAGAPNEGYHINLGFSLILSSSDLGVIETQKGMLMDDTVPIKCTRCKSLFRDRARRVQAGYSRQCPSCEVLIFFEESSADKNVQRALLEARRMRRALQEASVDDIRQKTVAFGPEAPRGADTNRNAYLRRRSY